VTNAEKMRLKVLQIKHCHILPTGTPGLSPRQRFLRNLCPLNHFLFPSPKRFSMSRIGWSERRNVVDLGESETVIGWIQQRLIQELGNQGGMYDRFLRLAGGTRSSVTSSDLRIQIRHRGNSERPEPISVGMQPTSSGGDSKTPKTPFKYCWTLNAEHGFYVQTSVKHEVIALSLRYRTLAGMINVIGEFLLDLAKLSAIGVVSARRVHDEVVYRVRIVREHDGTFWLRVRNDVSLDLRMFAV
jgi:hypothetical protein